MYRHYSLSGRNNRFVSESNLIQTGISTLWSAVRSGFFGILILLSIFISGCSRFDYDNFFSKMPDVAVVQFNQLPGGTSSNSLSTNSVDAKTLTLLATINLDPIPVGDSFTKDIFLKNIGELNAENLSITIDSPHYSVSTDCKKSLMALKDNICKVSMTFAPKKFASFPTELVVSYGNGRGKSILAKLPIRFNRDPHLASLEIGQVSEAGDLKTYKELENPYKLTLDPVRPGKTTTINYYLKNIGELTAEQIQFKFTSSRAAPHYKVVDECQGMLTGIKNNFCKISVTFDPIQDHDVFPTDLIVSYLDGVNTVPQSTTLKIQFSRAPKPAQLEYWTVPISNPSLPAPEITKGSNLALKNFVIDFERVAFGSENYIGLYVKNSGELDATQVQIDLLDRSLPANYSIVSNTCKSIIPGVENQNTCLIIFKFIPLAFDVLQAQLKFNYGTFSFKNFPKDESAAPIANNSEIKLTSISLNWAFLKLMSAPDKAQGAVVSPTTSGMSSSFPLYVSYSGDLLTPEQKLTKSINKAEWSYSSFKVDALEMQILSPTQSSYKDNWSQSTKIFELDTVRTSDVNGTCSFPNKNPSQPAISVPVCPSRIDRSCCIYVKFSPSFGNKADGQPTAKADFLANVQFSYSNGNVDGNKAKNDVKQRGLNSVVIKPYNINANLTVAGSAGNPYPSVVVGPAPYPNEYYPSKFSILISNPDGASAPGQNLKIDSPTNPVFSFDSHTCRYTTPDGRVVDGIPTSGCLIWMKFNPSPLSITDVFNGKSFNDNSMKITYDFADYDSNPQPYTTVMNLSSRSIRPAQLQLTPAASATLIDEASGTSYSRVVLNLGNVNTFYDAASLGQGKTIRFQNSGEAPAVLNLVSKPNNANFTVSGCGLPTAATLPAKIQTIAPSSSCTVTVNYTNNKDVSAISDSIVFNYLTGTTETASYPTRIKVELQASPISAPLIVPVNNTVNLAPSPAMFRRDSAVTGTVNVRVYGTDPIASGISTSVTAPNGSAPTITAADSCNSVLSSRSASAAAYTTCAFNVSKPAPGFSATKLTHTDTITFSAPSLTNATTNVVSVWAPPPILSFNRATYPMNDVNSSVQLGNVLEYSSLVQLTNSSTDFPVKFRVPQVLGGLPFSLTLGTCSCPLSECTLSSGASCVLNFTYSPTSVPPAASSDPFTHSDTISTSYFEYPSAAASPISATVNAYGSAKVSATASAASLNFGTVYMSPATPPSRTLTFTIRGVSNSAWLLNPITFNPVLPTGISLTSDTCSGRAANNSTCQMVFTYNPTDPAHSLAADAKIQFNYNSFPDAAVNKQPTPISIPVSATLRTGLDLSMSPSQVNFGDVYTNQVIRKNLNLTATGNVSTKPWFKDVTSLPAGVTLDTDQSVSTCINAKVGSSCVLSFLINPNTGGNTNINSNFTLNYYPNPDSATPTTLNATIPIRSVFHSAIGSEPNILSVTSSTLKAMASSYTNMNSDLYKQRQWITIQYTGPSSQNISTTNFPTLTYSSSGTKFALDSSPFTILAADHASLVDPVLDLPNKSLDCRGKTLTVGQTCKLPVQFAPSQFAASLSDTLTVEFTASDSSQTGKATRVMSGTPTKPVTIYTGGNTACMVNEFGTVYCWGDNSSGQLGTGTNSNQPLIPNMIPVKSSAIANLTAIPFGASVQVLQLAIGKSHVCALLKTASSNGAVTCWGSNSSGQLGFASPAATSSPFTGPSLNLVSLPMAAKSISVGYDHSCAVLQNDSLQCWGSNGSGQLGIESDSSPNLSPMVLTKQISNVTQITSGISVTCAITNANSNIGAKCWGNNRYGQIGQKRFNVDPAVDASSHGWDYGATTGDMSRLNFIQLGLPAGQVQQISSSIKVPRTCVLVNNLVKCFGLAVPPDGTFFGLLGNVFNHAESYGGGDDEMLNLPAVPIKDPISNSSLMSQVSVGGEHTCVMYGDGNTSSTGVGCWGMNDSGQLGNGNSTNVGSDAADFATSTFKSSFEATIGFSPVQVATGNSSSCAVASDNSLWCWGMNMPSTCTKSPLVPSGCKVYDGSN